MPRERGELFALALGQAPWAAKSKVGPSLAVCRPLTDSFVWFGIATMQSPLWKAWGDGDTGKACMCLLVRPWLRRAARPSLAKTVRQAFALAVT